MGRWLRPPQSSRGQLPPRRPRDPDTTIYPVKDSRGRVTGYRGYGWCTKPDGERYQPITSRAKPTKATRRAWFKLRDDASRGPVSSDVPKLSDFLLYWLKEIVQPNLAPKTYQTYELFVRPHRTHPGHKQIDQLGSRTSTAMDQHAHAHLPVLAQGKDAARPVSKRRCCAVGECCRAILSPQSRKDARATLRAAFACAVEEEIISRDPVAVIRLPAPRKSKRRVWTVDEARRFLESARQAVTLVRRLRPHRRLGPAQG